MQPLIWHGAGLACSSSISCHTVLWLLLLGPRGVLNSTMKGPASPAGHRHNPRRSFGGPETFRIPSSLLSSSTPCPGDFRPRHQTQRQQAQIDSYATCYSYRRSAPCNESLVLTPSSSVSGTGPCRDQCPASPGSSWATPPHAHCGQPAWPSICFLFS